MNKQTSLTKLNLIQTIIIIIVAFIFYGCSGKPQREEIKEKSGYVGKTYKLKIPVVSIENLPHVENVSKEIAANTNVLMAKEASKSMQYILNRCLNCIDSERLVQPLRVRNITVGEKFRVIGEYLYFVNRFPLGNAEIPFLLIEDKNGEITEISKSSFEGFFIPRGPGYSDKKLVDETLELIKKFDKMSKVPILYCPYSKVKEKEGILKFINEFKLNSDVTLSDTAVSCEGGQELIFENATSFMTAHYYFFEWGLNGKWKQAKAQTDKFKSNKTQEPI